MDIKCPYWFICWIFNGLCILHSNLEHFWYIWHFSGTFDIIIDSIIPAKPVTFCCFVIKMPVIQSNAILKRINVLSRVGMRARVWKYIQVTLTNVSPNINIVFQLQKPIHFFIVGWKTIKNCCFYFNERSTWVWTW